MSIKPEIGQLWRSKHNGRIYRVMSEHGLLGRDNKYWTVGLVEGDRNDHDPWKLWAKMDWFEHAAERVEPEEPAVATALPVVATRWPVLTDLLAKELDILERLLAMYREGKHAGDRFIEKVPGYHLDKAQGHIQAWWYALKRLPLDSESEEPILAHVAARALFALACEQRGKR